MEKFPEHPNLEGYLAPYQTSTIDLYCNNN